MKADYLIIGGGVAGTMAAEAIRAADVRSTITIVSEEPHRFYSRILLSKPTFFLEKLPFDSVYLKSEAWYGEKKIQLLHGQMATALDVTKKVVTLLSGEHIEYGKLLLATGTCARPWSVKGAEKKGVLYLRTLDDAKMIIAAVKTAKRAVVIGGGFIGFEMCDMLRLAGIDTTLVIREKYFWEPVLDEPSGRIIEKALKGGGVKILHETLAEEVTGGDCVDGVRLTNGTKLPADLVIAGVGTQCDLAWVKTAGIACNTGILTNEFLETNIQDVFAAGDIAEYQDVLLEEHIQLGNWANAHLHGKVAAANMLGGRIAYHRVSFYTAQGFGIAIAFVGDVRLNDKRQVIVRSQPDGNALTRIIVQNGKIEGATMVNRTADMAPLTKLIESNVKVEPMLERLKDTTVDLQSFVPHS